jgi:hypothetical protein
MLDKLINLKIPIGDLLKNSFYAIVSYQLYITKTTVNKLEMERNNFSETLSAIRQELRVAKAERDYAASALKKLKESVEEQAINPPNVDLIIANNDMTKFLIQWGCVTVLAGACIYLIYSILPLSYTFSLKSLLPVYCVEFLQKNTPLCQTKESLTWHDEKNHLDWVIYIINGKTYEPFVKPCGFNDFQHAGNFITKLNSTAGTIVQHTTHQKSGKEFSLLSLSESNDAAPQTSAAVLKGLAHLRDSCF